jgi:activating signal cointegrator 1
MKGIRHTVATLQMISRSRGLMQQTYRVIIVRQPFASLIAIGAKQYQPQDKPTRYRGPIAIYTGTSVRAFKEMGCYKEDSGAFWPNCVKAFRDAGQPINEREFSPADWPLGAMIAIGELVGCFPTEALWLSDREKGLGNFTPGRYGWKITNVRHLPAPVYMPVQHGFWEWRYEYQT